MAFHCCRCSAFRKHIKGLQWSFTGNRMQSRNIIIVFTFLCKRKKCTLAYFVLNFSFHTCSGPAGKQSKLRQCMVTTEACEAKHREYTHHLASRFQQFSHGFSGGVCKFILPRLLHVQLASESQSDLLPTLHDPVYACTDPHVCAMLASQQVFVSVSASTKHQRVQKGDLLLHLHFGQKQGVIIHGCFASSELQFLVEPMHCIRSAFGNLADWWRPTGTCSLMLVNEIDQFCHPTWWLRQDAAWLTLR